MSHNFGYNLLALGKKLIRRKNMKRKIYQVSLSAALVVVIVAFLSAIFFVNADPSFAASSKKKSSAAVGGGAKGARNGIGGSVVIGGVFS